MNVGLSAAILILASVPCLPAADPDRNFAGKWVLDKAASNRQAQPAAPDESLTVTQDELALRCASPASAGPASQWSYLLDGTETRSHIGTETRNSVAKWEGSALLINTLVSGPRDYTVMDRWQLSRDRSTLSITRQVVERGNTSENVLLYRREGQLGARQAPATATQPRTKPDSRDPFPTPEALDAALKRVPGVLENGLFLGIADAAVIAVGSVGLDIDVMASLDGQEGRPTGASRIAELVRRFQRGDFDLVSVGRSQIGDPEWVTKVADHRIPDIRPFRSADPWLSHDVVTP